MTRSQGAVRTICQIIVSVDKLVSLIRKTNSGNAVPLVFNRGSRVPHFVYWWGYLHCFQLGLFANHLQLVFVFNWVILYNSRRRCSKLSYSIGSARALRVCCSATLHRSRFVFLLQCIFSFEPTKFDIGFGRKLQLIYDNILVGSGTHTPTQHHGSTELKSDRFI